MLDSARVAAAQEEAAVAGGSSGRGVGGGEESRRLESELLAVRSRLTHLEHVSRSRCGARGVWSGTDRF